jgi:TolB-like protein
MGRFRHFLLAALALCLILGFVYWQFYRPSRYLSTGKDIASIAVVPFECLSPELDCGAFPHGLNDLLVAHLSQIDRVHVLSPSTVSRYQRARLSMAFMARVLGMDVMLEGTVQRTGDRVRITARLVDVHSAKLVWSESYEYPVQQLAEAQNRATREIAAQVGAHLANPQKDSEARFHIWNSDIGASEYSGTRIAIPRNHCTQVDAPPKKWRPRMNPKGVQLFWFRSSLREKEFPNEADIGVFDSEKSHKKDPVLRLALVRPDQRRMGWLPGPRLTQNP